MEPVIVKELAKENWKIQNALIDMPALQRSNLTLNFQKSLSHVFTETLCEIEMYASLSTIFTKGQVL